MMSTDGDGPGLVLKQTKIMTNCPEVAKQMDRRCSNREIKEKKKTCSECTEEEHRHVALINGRASQAQVYPRSFCQAICEGVSAQRKMDSGNVVMMDVMSMEEI